jgi:hypothetical protein
MKMILFKSVCTTAIALMAFSLVSPIAHAQTGADATPGVAKSVANVKVTDIALAQVVLRLTRESGVTVVAESTLATRPITVSATGGSLESVLTKLASALPKGAVIRATLTPQPDITTLNGAADGDAVATLLRAQDVFAPKPPAGIEVVKPQAFVPGKFEFMGQMVTLAEVAPQIAALHLRPVYVVMMQRPALDPVSKLSSMQTAAMHEWANMTADQRKEAMELQFHSMMNMDPADRVAMLGQMMDQGKYMMQMMQSMPPDQMKQFMSEITQTANASGIIPKGPGAGTPPAPTQP